MMNDYTKIDADLIEHLDDSLDELGVLVTQPSVGAQNWGMQARAHAPNENIRIDLYLKHARHMARVLGEFSK